MLRSDTIADLEPTRCPSWRLRREALTFLRVATAEMAPEIEPGEIVAFRADDERTGDGLFVLATSRTPQVFRVQWWPPTRQFLVTQDGNPALRWELSRDELALITLGRVVGIVKARADWSGLDLPEPGSVWSGSPTGAQNHA